MRLIPPGVPDSQEVILDGSGRAWSRRELGETLAARSAQLTDAGGRGHIVALCQPSDAELALNVLAVMSVGSAAPLHPAATEAEATAYLEDLRPQLIITGPSSPAGRAARNLGIEVLLPEQVAAERTATVEDEAPDPASVALLLPTSGTTGRPKLVPLTHANLTASAHNVADSLQLTGDDRCLGLMPFFHIHGVVAGLMAPLVSGGSVVAAGTFDPARIRPWLEEYGPTWYTGVPAMHRAVLDALRRGAPPRHRLRFVRSASSPLAPVLMAELEQTLGVPAIEAYGMTEASHQLATNPLPPAARKPGTVGVASGGDIALLTDGAVHTDSDRTGEVLVRGPMVTAGYLNHAEANAEAFHDGWFRTGDLGRLDAEGYVSLVGRIKEMINRGGEKIAPREVDEALLAHPAVAQAAAFPVPHPTLGEDVAAVVVVRPDHEVSPSELIDFVTGRLSAYKIPRRLVIAERIPVGPTGKPQRARMAGQLGLDEGIGDQSTAEGRSDLESIWCTILGVDHVPGDADFFTLGGDSLMALTLVATIEEEQSRTVPLSFFSEGGATLGRMEQLLDRSEPVSVPVAGPGAGPEAVPGREAISLAERGVLAGSHLDPTGALYNQPIAVRLQGPLDLNRLQTAVRVVVAASEGLRTCFPQVEGHPVRSVVPSLQLPLELRVVDPADDVTAILRAEARRPFDLAHGPLIRATVLMVGERDHVLMLTAHHAIVDGLARDIVLERVAAAYRLPSVAPAGTESPSVIAARQRADLASGRLDEDRDYWLAQLTPLPEPLALAFPSVNIRPTPELRAGDVIGFDLDPDTSIALRQLARSNRTTPFAVFLAGLSATLSRLTGAQEVVVGTPAANRHRSGSSGTIGMVANLVPLRIDVVGDPTFEDLVGRVRTTALGALAHQEYPYERMLEDLRRQSTVVTDGLFQVTCQLRASPAVPSFGEECTESRVPVHTGTAKFDLSFDMRDDPQGLGGTVEFKTDVFSRRQVEDICDRLGRLLAAAAAGPAQHLSRLPLLSPDELRQVVARAQGPEPLPATRNAVEPFIDQARRTPEAPAVNDIAGVLSYGELEAESALVATALAQRGVGRGATVGISLRPDRRMIAVVLGVLRAGAAYLPLDPSYPPARLQAMVAALPPHVVVYADERPLLPEGVPAVRYGELLETATGKGELPPGPGPDDAAYVLYTSGSTGTPKGVVVPHAAIVNLLSWTSRTFGGRDLARVLVGSSLNFDVSVLEIFAPLAAGGCLVLVDNVLALRDLDVPITLLSTVPTALRALLDADAIPEHVRAIVSGGEVLSRELALRLLALPQRPRLINSCGPTEVTVFCCATDIDSADGAPPIGKPIDGALTLVVDRFDCPLPVGYPGGLLVGGRGLSQGYLNDPALTAARFVPVEVPGIGWQRMYRSGDLTWADADGQIHYLQRMDDQLKIRGIRIEPGDVESALLRHPEVTRAAVYGVDNAGVGELHAAVTTGTASFDGGELRRWLAPLLPAHMVPRRILHLDSLPLGATGKVNRRALAAMSQRALCPVPDQAASASEDIVSVLLSVWQRLLRTAELGIDTEFFAAGGDSLLVLAMLTEVDELLGCRLPLDWCFSGPVTVRRLAAEVRRISDAGAGPDQERPGSVALLPVRTAGDKPPLFIIYASAASALSSRSLADELAPGRPVYALAPIWTEVASRADVVERMAGAITGVTSGPAHLAGHSIGGPIAYETAALLEAGGWAGGALIIVDSRTPELTSTVRPRTLRARVRAMIPKRIPSFWHLSYWRQSPWRRAGVDRPDLGAYAFPNGDPFIGYWRDNPPTLQRPLDLLITSYSSRYGAFLGWDEVHGGAIVRRRIPGNHTGFVRSMRARQATARVIDGCLDAADSNLDAAQV